MANILMQSLTKKPHQLWKPSPHASEYKAITEKQRGQSDKTVIASDWSVLVKVLPELIRDQGCVTKSARKHKVTL
jgi:hypothetical protein